MSRDEARKLLGGYATGSLTEAERTALFQAALEDQELFDELAGEQVLKEVLDEPGARQRLITALEPQKHRVWLWGWAGAVAALAIMVGVVIFQRTPPPPQQIAQVIKSPEPAAALVAPPAAAPAPAPLKRKVAPAPPPAPAAPEPQAKPQAAAGAMRQFAAAVAPVVFAFNYSVGADGFLVIVPTARGFLSVTANDAVIFPSGAVGAGTPIRISIPPDVTSLVIAFSGMPGITGAPVRRDEPSGTVTDQDPPNGKILIQLFPTPATR